MIKIFALDFMSINACHLKIKSENSLKPFQNLVKFLSLLAVLLGLMYFDEFLGAQATRAHLIL